MFFWQKIRLAKKFVKAFGEQCNKRVICLHTLYCKGPSGDSFLAPSLFMSFMGLGWHISVNASSQWGRIHKVILIATSVYDFTIISFSNFSCMFLNPNIFFQFEFELF